MNLSDIRQSYLDDGIDYENASARTAQDTVLDMIAASSLAGNVTIKGGVVMQHLSSDTRRATLDIDFDFLRYSISDDSIRRFIEALNHNAKGFSIAVTGKIEELKHQDYSGKRVHVRISDSDKTQIQTKLDIGVHAEVNLKQTPLYFDLNKLDEGVTLLANSKEQIVAEKMKSLLRIGAASTRYKDVFDIYYLIVEDGLEEKAFQNAFETVIFADPTMRENNLDDVFTRLDRVLHDRRFVPNLGNAKNNWLQLPTDKVIDGILSYISQFPLLPE